MTTELVKQQDEAIQAHAVLDAAEVPRLDAVGLASLASRIGWLVRNKLRQDGTVTGDKLDVLRRAINNSYLGAPFDKPEERAAAGELRQRAYDALGELLEEHRLAEIRAEERILQALLERDAAQAEAMAARAELETLRQQQSTSTGRT